MSTKPSDKITITFEISISELQKALLPQGGKITGLSIPSTPPKRRSVKKSTPSTASSTAKK